MMAQDSKTAFQWRAFISTLTGLSFVAMCLTGIILFVVPPGRVANWTGWTLYGLTKAQWQALHIWFSLLFMVAAIVHIVYNWQCLLRYCQSKVTKAFTLRAEWSLSLVLCVVLLVATLANWRPFSSLVDWGESIKHSWDDPTRRPPVPHMELLTLSALAEQVEDIPLDTMLENLRARNIAVDSPDAIVGELAAAHGMTPETLYNIAIGAAHRGHGRGAGQPGGGGSGGGRGMSGGGGGGGSGFGRMTLEQYCADAGIDTDAAIEKLRATGVTATRTTTIREIADAANIRPSAVPDLLTP
ncbi:MAG: DUF4405 domain-containing protein [Sedimentisphaerales bacterium]|nr:DUF4405 domain-containing protein [Sedimentisphaerales bacterium]